MMCACAHACGSLEPVYEARFESLRWSLLVLLVVFALVMVGVGRWVSHGPDVRGMHHPSLHGQGTVQPALPSDPTPATPAQTPAAGAEAERCKVPEFAKAMGHETIWKQHNGCL